MVLVSGVVRSHESIIMKYLFYGWMVSNFVKQEPSLTPK